MKRLINYTSSPVTIVDTGVTVAGNSTYTIPPTDYLLWAASSNICTAVGDTALVVNDGSFDLTISDGIDLIKGLFPTVGEDVFTPNRVIISDTLGHLSIAGTSDVEVDYLEGTTSSVQTQLNGKQPLDSDLTALAALSTTGLLVRTGAGTATTRAITAGTAITVTSGDGVAGNPTVTLPDTAVAPGTYGDSTHVAQITVDQQGRLTAASSVSVGGGSGITQLTGDVTAGPGSGSQAATVAKIQGTVVSGTTGTTNVVFSTSPTLTGTAIIPAITGAASAGAQTVTGGTAASGGAGGQVTIAGAGGSGVGAGGAGGNATMNGGNANGDNTQNNNGGAISLQAGTSKGSATGGTATLNSGTGGTGTGTAGATGGTTNVNGGTGGAGSVTSGNGGGATLKAGSGGGGVGGGTGGATSVTGGTGGTGSGSGGNGGAVSVTGGSAASSASAAGGAVTVAGAGGSGTGAGGAGGSVTLTGGSAGGDNTQNNTGGSITVTAGNSKGSSGGAAVTMNTGVGGIGTSTLGANGGDFNFNAGAGGVGSATGGVGGNLKFTAGSGGNSGSPGAGGIMQFFTSATTSSLERLRIKATGEVLVSNAPVQIGTVGQGLQVKGGANCTINTVVLSGGTVTVSNTAVTTNSQIFLTSQADGGTPGFLRITAKTAATSFVITSSNPLDTSTVAWFIVEKI